MADVPEKKTLQAALATLIDLLLEARRDGLIGRKPEQYVQFVRDLDLTNAERKASLEAGLRAALEFLHEFFEHAGAIAIPPEPPAAEVASRLPAKAPPFAPKTTAKAQPEEEPSECANLAKRTLGKFLQQYSQAFPAPTPLRSLLEQLGKLFPGSSPPIRSRSVAFPVTLFQTAQAEADELKGYRERVKQDPVWWQLRVDKRGSPDRRSPDLGSHEVTAEDPPGTERKDRRPKVRVLRCWLHERDRTPGGSDRWRSHCHLGCIVDLLNHHYFSLTEIEACLSCGNCRSGIDYCHRPVPASDEPGGPMIPDERREDAAARRQRAAAFAGAMVTRENLAELLSVLLPTQPARPEPRKRSGLFDLPSAWRWQSVALAFALIAFVVAVVILNLPRPVTTLAMVMNKDPLRSEAPGTPPFIRALPDPLNVVFDPANGTFTVTSPLGDRLLVSGRLTNNAAAGGKLWAGTAMVSGLVQGNQAVSGAGDIRIRTVTPKPLIGLKSADLEWVSLELQLTNSVSRGALSLVFGTP